MPDSLDPYRKTARRRKKTARKELDRYRGFRHVVRNVYAFEFDSEQISILVKHLPETTDHMQDDLLRFADTLDEIGQSEG